LQGCGEALKMSLRFAAHPWPGYEMLYLARQQGRLPADRVLLIETPSASANLRALANRTADGAALTLDEVLTARSRGLPLVVVAVVDVSMGADVVLVRPELAGPRSTLRGLRIGIEASATAAVMMQACLARQGLTLAQVRPVAISVDQHVEAYQHGRVDAVVSYDPASVHLQALGAVPVFSSADIPGRIVDVLAVRQDVLVAQAESIRLLVAVHFAALASWLADPAAAQPLLSARLKLPVEALAKTYSRIALPDLAANRLWLGQGGGEPSLMPVARSLMQVMRSASLLGDDLDLRGLVDARFLP
jgi:NitT/TauT family transport system substrate-binding protein